MAARAESIFPARAIDPDPSRRMVKETGAFCDFSNMSLRTAAPSTNNFTSPDRKSVRGFPFGPIAVKGIIT